MRQHGKTGIARDLTVWLVLGYMLLSAPLAFFGYYKATKAHEQRLEKQAKSLCNKFSAVLTEPVWNVDEEAVMAYFNSFRIPEDLVSVRVLTQYGDLICNFSIYDDPNVEICRDSVIKDSEQIGIIEVSISRAKLHTFKKQIGLLCLTSLLVVAASIALLSAFLMRLLVGQPLNTLGKQLRVIASGDYAKRPLPHKYREINNINEEVNSMAIQIAGSTAALKSEINERKRAELALHEMANNLEELVNHRTAQLTEVNDALIQESEHRKRVQREMLDICHREQRRIGQDLHDALGQQLAGIAYLAGSLERNLKSKESTDSKMAGQIAALLRESVSHTRRIAKGLSPVEMEDEGLSLALQGMAANTHDLFRVECYFSCKGGGSIHSNDVAVHLFHIAQEAIHNAIRHGNATKIDVTLSTVETKGVLSIHDNGCGFSPERQKSDGMGLRTMAYRAEIAGGTLDIHCKPEQGTTITARFDNSPDAQNSSDTEHTSSCSLVR
jgi:signal transduction histidine kinase